MSIALSLERLFGSHYRVKLIRLFLLNPETVFSPKDAARRTKVPALALRRELATLQQAGLIRRASRFVSMHAPPAQQRKQWIHGWMLEKDFSLLSELRQLVLSASPVSRRELADKIRRTGRIKLITVGGIFLRADTRLDLLVVGDGIKKRMFEKVLRDAEAEIGKELIYAQLSTDEFTYRLGMYDRFIREILEHPHEHIVNKLDVA